MSTSNMKKKASKKDKKKSGPKPGRARKSGASRSKERPAPMGARSQPLPGMGVKNVRLDNICESIADERAVMNAASLEEKSLISSALQVMQEKKLTVWKHGGVELVRVPGADKLRVKLTKDQGDTNMGDGASNSSQSDLVDPEAADAPRDNGDGEDELTD